VYPSNFVEATPVNSALQNDAMTSGTPLLLLRVSRVIWMWFQPISDTDILGISGVQIYLGHT
jgi:hypothetical protein